MTTTASADDTGALNADARPAALSFTPKPGAAPASRMILAQAAHEVRLMLRNPEQLLLTIVIPALMMVLFSGESLVATSGPGKRIDFYAPGLFGAAVLSTAFTGLAIATGFERRYGVLKRLGASPLSRQGLIAAKTVTVLMVELGQAAIVLAVGALLGWAPVASPAAVVWVPLLLLAGTAAFSGLALLLAGTLRAEATLAAANLLYLIMLGLGGVLVPLSKFPPAVQSVLKLLPPGALSDGLRSVLAHAGGLPVRDLLVLCVWAVAAIALAVRTFRWE